MDTALVFILYQICNTLDVICPSCSWAASVSCAVIHSHYNGLFQTIVSLQDMTKTFRLLLLCNASSGFVDLIPPITELLIHNNRSVLASL